MDEEIRRLLADSGEELARTASALRGGTADVPALFRAAAAHMNHLSGAGLAEDAFATGVMAVLTAFSSRFNPADCAAEYLCMLLKIAMDGAVAVNMVNARGDEFAAGHYAEIEAELGPLVLASYRSLNGPEILPQQLQQPFEALDGFVDTDYLFQNRRIEATMAPDIFYDIASRLTAIGTIE